MTEIGLFEAIYSARTLRRLKPDPVPDDVIARILDARERSRVRRAFPDANAESVP